MPPNVATAFSIIAVVAEGSDTSARQPIAWPPTALISATALSIAARSERPLITKDAPRAARSKAIARPIFFPAPVTRATLPTKLTLPAESCPPPSRRS